MATVIVNHRVKDYASWKVLFDSDGDRRDEMGMKLLAVGQRAGDAGNAYLIFDVADVSHLEQIMSNPELKQAMMDSGVISEPEVIVLQ